MLLEPFKGFFALKEDSGSAFLPRSWGLHHYAPVHWAPPNLLLHWPLLLTPTRELWTGPAPAAILPLHPQEQLRVWC